MIAALLLALALPLTAASRDFWRFETAGDFLSGESRGVSIGPDGQLRLAPVLRELHAAEQPFLWRIAAAGADAAVVAGGAGMLLRVRGDAIETLAESREGGIHAVATGADGTVFYAASPGGAIHRIGPDGQRAVVADPDARYVWALAVEPGGSVLAATGSPAALLRIQPSGSVATVFESAEENLTALHRGSDGAIYLGTAPSGIVFRVDPGGDAMALFDSEQTEIGQIVVNAAGEVFATTLTDSTGPGAAPAEPPPEPDGGALIAAVTTFSSFRPPALDTQAPDGASNALYRIEANGAAEAIWESAEERPLALALLRDERLLLGTGNRGRIYRIAPDGDRTLLLRVESEQVTAALAGDRILLGTSNPARVLAVGPGGGTEGSYQSRVLDAGGAARFGRIRWEARAPSGTTLTVETRTGNSEEPDDTWSDWDPAVSGDPVVSPPARFFQWRATLRSDGGASPELVSLTTAWLAANRRPKVTAITIHPPGAGFEQMQSPQPVRVQGMANPLEPSEAGRRAQGGALGFGVGSGRRIYHPGLRTITFEASDPNGDRLQYSVGIRRVGAVAWDLLAESLRETVFAWDTSALPDGRYELRVAADDRRDNPAGEALDGEKVSRSFIVDNTPPVITDLTLGPGGGIRFAASDSASPIRRATVSVDGGPAQVIRPVDGVSDSLDESYDAQLAGVASGSGVVVRVEDDLGNWVTAEARAEP